MAAALTGGRRGRLVGLLCALLVVTIALVTLGWGDLGVKPDDLLAAVTGDADRRTTMVLERLRGPRVLVAIGAGMALGLSGTLFQSVTRNPLGSPDVIGLGTGAGAGVALFSVFASGAASIWLGAMAGAGVAVLVVYLSTGRGFASTSRLIIAGIAVASMASAITHYVVATVLRDAGSQLAGYLVGSLNSRSMQHVLMIAVALAICIPLAARLGHDLQVMDMGDDLADSLGVNATRLRGAAILVSVLAAAGAVSVAGPISFVALSAPHIARRLVRTPGPHLALSALIGALILLASDLIVQTLPILEGLPVGVVTAGVGGIYLGVVLVNEWKKASA